MQKNLFLVCPNKILVGLFRLKMHKKFATEKARCEKNLIIILLIYAFLVCTNLTISPTVLNSAAASSGISIPYSWSSVINISTMSNESAPKSEIILDYIVIFSCAILSLSANNAFISSNTIKIFTSMNFPSIIHQNMRFGNDF